MRIKRIILLYFIVINSITTLFSPASFSYNPSSEEIIHYITTISNDIYRSIQRPDSFILKNSTGRATLKLFLSPWGELKDAYISESSGNPDLDNLCLKSARSRSRYNPFPEELGDNDAWIDIPVIFEVKNEKDRAIAASEPGTVKKLGINEAVDIALENYMAAKISQDEIGLAKLKVREAKRGLYPTASINYLETTGKTTGTTQDFTDKEYKVKFEYPLYYGWRLKYALSQAVSNMNASTENYNKILNDLRIEVETAYYSYIASSMNLELQKKLLDEGGKIYDIAKKRYDIGLSTKAEFLQVESQIKQINYQVISSENEFALAKLALTQAMNTEEPDKTLNIINSYPDPGKELVAVDIDITLEECMDIAFKTRPDLKSKEYMVEFNDYERKINESKNQLRVDLTGTYGRSGGAFESETLDLQPDWYLGFKITKPLAGNSISAMYTKDKTSQKHGQTTRTESIARSLELGLLDNLQHYSEKKSAEIGYKKAKDELGTTKDNIVKEVKESYLNFKKGVVQVRTNLNKIKYREEDLKIAKARTELNEISLSEYMQALISLTDEKSYYVEALGGLYQSLAKLNKATGFALFIDDENFKLASAK